MIQVGVLFGGPSNEHEVSCSSALSVVRALDPDRFLPVAVGVTRDRGFVLVPDDVLEKLLVQQPGARAIDDRLEVTGEPVELRRDSAAAGRVLVTPYGLPDVVLATLDVVFPVLHGPFGEDGVLQGFLETIGARYVGNGVLPSAIGMDKVAMKRAFLAEGLPVTPHVWFDEVRWARDQAVEGLELPLFVKPANMGSSIGISRVTSYDDLPAAVAEALKYDIRVIVEQGVAGREIECSVLGGFEPEASPVGEVTVSGGWFDYEQKYFGDSDPMIVPADLPGPVADQVRELSVQAFTALGCWGLARVDFLYDERAGKVILNELNTLPGFTAHSMYPKLWAATGLGYTDLLARLIDLAFERSARWEGRR